MIENSKEAVEQDIEISVEEDSVDAKEQVASEEQELDKYTKGVSKRINKLNAKTRAAEERAALAERIAQEREQEILALRQHKQAQDATVILREEEALTAKEQQADELYKKAVQSGDADLMSKADTLKSDLSIQKEKVRLAKNKQETEQAQYNQTIQQQPQTQQQVQQEAVEPTKEALSWYEKNRWYGDGQDQGNLEATQYEPDSNEYYEELNNRIYKVYPHLQNASADNIVEQSEVNPPVQRVASASVGSRQKTPGKKNGVTFSKSEVERLRGLKPHNMTEESWLKRVAAEKQKISQREAR